MKNYALAIASAAIVCSVGLAHAEEPSGNGDLAVWFELEQGKFRSGYLVAFADGSWRITVAGEDESILQREVKLVGFGARPDWYKKAEPVAEPTHDELEKRHPTNEKPPRREPRRPKEPLERPAKEPWTGGRGDDFRRPGVRRGERLRPDMSLEEAGRKRLEAFRNLRDPKAREKELDKIEKALSGTADPRTAAKLMVLLYSAYKVAGVPAEKIKGRAHKAIAGIKDPDVRKAVDGTLFRLKMMDDRRRRFGGGGPGGGGRGGGGSGRMPERGR